VPSCLSQCFVALRDPLLHEGVTLFLDLGEFLREFIGFDPGCIQTAEIGVSLLECNWIVLIDQTVLSVSCLPHEEVPGQEHEIEDGVFYTFAAVLDVVTLKSAGEVCQDS
jgi:hypothetical protein